MSAIAMACTKKEIHLISDGMATKDGNVYCEDSSKIIKPTSRVGILWMGVCKHAIGNIIELDIKAKKLTEPLEIAECVGKHLKDTYSQPGAVELLEDKIYWVLVVGYNLKGNIEAYRVWSGGEDQFTPEPVKMTFGQLGAKTQMKGPDETSFQRLLATKYVPMYRGAKGGLKRAVRRAFEEMIEECQADLELVGGEIYQVTLKP